jgi:hypothetical protein
MDAIFSAIREEEEKEQPTDADADADLGCFVLDVDGSAFACAEENHAPNVFCDKCM